MRTNSSARERKRLAFELLVGGWRTGQSLSNVPVYGLDHKHLRLRRDRRSPLGVRRDHDVSDGGNVERLGARLHRVPVIRARAILEPLLELLGVRRILAVEVR